jgi:hypothetical protein
MASRAKPNTKVFSIIVFLIFVFIGYLVYKNYVGNPTSYSDSAPQKYISNAGSFSIELPSDIHMIEKPERFVDGFTNGEVWFAWGVFDDNNPKGLVITYGKPTIDGKGGACVDENGESMYTSEIIAEQNVDVCAGDSFSASYFTHPNKKIEYDVSIYGPRLTQEQFEILTAAVRSSLRFE